ncbi:glycosyltransferase, family I [Desulfosarcina variabilis str. Montpellier]|uniref:glycosyltransferase family 4 protein n=1 Tax=Desulfosarcina variabilis TaxID=2300 RepID=UPI003AFA29B4
MKIVIATKSFYYQRIGGAEYQCYLISKFLIENGHEVHYLYLSNRSLTNYSSPIIIHKIKKLKHIGRTGLETPLYFLKLIRVLNEIDPDVIYLRGRSAISIICCIFAKIKKIRTIFHIAHDNDLLKPRIIFSFKNILKYPEHKLFAHLLYHFHRIISQTTFQSKKLYHYFGISSFIIPNGHPAPKVKKFKKCNNNIKVFWVANLKPMKRPDIFIRLAQILGYNKNLKFMMIGRSNNNNSRIINDINNTPNLYFLGEVQNEIVNKHLEEAHILVNTSIAEGFSNTFIQAWMRKVPVVSLNVDPDGIIKKYNLGFHSTSFNQLVIDVMTLANNQFLREEMGTRAQIFAFQNYSLNNIYRVVNLIENSH